MEQRILLHWKSHLLLLHLSPIWMLPCLLMIFDYLFFLQRNRKTILLGTFSGEMKEFNFMTGQVRENLSPYCHHHCHRNYIGHLITIVVNFLTIIITLFQPYSEHVFHFISSRKKRLTSAVLAEVFPCASVQR